MSESVNENVCVRVCALAHVHALHLRMHMRDTTLSGRAQWLVSQPARTAELHVQITAMTQQ